MLEEKRQFSRVLKLWPIFPVSLLLLSSCSFPISQAGIHKIRKGKLMGHYSTTSVYISMKQHVPSSATYASQDRYFRIRNFHQLISVYVLTTRVAKCMRYYRRSIVLKIINYKVKFFRILNASTTSYSIFELPEYMYLYIWRFLFLLKVTGAYRRGEQKGRKPMWHYTELTTQANQFTEIKAELYCFWHGNCRLSLYI